MRIPSITDRKKCAHAHTHGSTHGSTHAHARAHTHILKHQTPSSSSGSSSIFHTLHRLIWLNGLFRRCVLRGRCVCVRRLQVVQLDGIMTTRRPHPAHAWNVLDLTCSGHQALTQSPDACTSSAPAVLFHKSACYVVSFDVNAEVKWPLRHQDTSPDHVAMPAEPNTEAADTRRGLHRRSSSPLPRRPSSP